jgi:hypothetical protein
MSIAFSTEQAHDPALPQYWHIVSAAAKEARARAGETATATSRLFFGFWFLVLWFLWFSDFLVQTNSRGRCASFFSFFQ